MNVWDMQLCPAVKDIPEGAKVHNEVIILEWKELINILHLVNESDLTSYTEKSLIRDFFEVVNSQFDYLNPYNALSKCHSYYLANKRIEQILKDIALIPDNVKMHSGWGYNITVDLPEFKKIALTLHHDEKDIWSGITLAVDFGSTVSQARKFYSNVNSYDDLEDLRDFSFYCNFHLAVQAQNIMFFKSPENSIQQYFKYWKSDVHNNFGGVLKDELHDKFLLNYEKKGLIVYDSQKQQDVKDVILSKRYPRINICPAIYGEYYISREDATKLDSKNNLSVHFKEKIEEIMNKLNHSVATILK